MQSLEQLLAEWSAAHALTDLMSRADEAAGAQIADALQVLPGLLEADSGPRVEVVERWFAAVLRRPPLGQDTVTYNRVHASVEDLKARLGAVQ